METTDYCDYKVSLALKAAGFDESCDYFWAPSVCSKQCFVCSTLLPGDPSTNFNDISYNDERCSAPTLWHAQKWLRNKGIEVYVLLTDDNAGYEWGIYDRNICDNIDGYLGDGYKTYEQALSAGIARAVELIKKGE